ncbi:MAG: transglutaminase TgpA family protein [Streptosporangiaceae bacterium]
MTANRRMTVTVAFACALSSTVLYPLFTSSEWFYVGLGAIITVAASGALSRLRTLPVAVCLAISVAGLLLYMNLVFEVRHSWALIIPTPGSLSRLWDLAGTGMTDAGRYASPAPPMPDLLVLAVGGIGITAILTDLIAVRLRSTALAGLPLLVLFTVPITMNAQHEDFGTAVVFCLGTVGYLAMLSADGRERIRVWGRLVSLWRSGSLYETATRPGPGRAGADVYPGRPAEEQTSPAYRSTGREPGPDTRALAAAGRRVGLASVVLALAVPLLVPGLHPSKLFSSGPGIGGSGGSGTGVGLSLPDTLSQTLRDLQAKHPTTVLSYTTTAGKNPPYLQTYVYDDLTDSGWHNTEYAAGEAQASTIPAAQGLLDQAAYRQVRTAINVAGDALDNRTAPTFLAMPYPATQVTTPPGIWLTDNELMVFSQYHGASVQSYQATSVDVAPTTAQLRAAQKPPGMQADLALPSSYQTKALKQIADEHTAGQTTEYDKVNALAAWLSGPTFAYSAAGAPVNSAASLYDFLAKTHLGVCVQSAWAMTVLTRLLGIPARLAGGFTEGTHVSAKTYVVKTDDAHVWAQVYFSGYGWINFEATPPGGDGTAQASSYQSGTGTGNSLPPVIPGSIGSSAGPTKAPPTAGGEANKFVGAGGGSGSGLSGKSGGTPWAAIVLAILAAIALACGVIAIVAPPAHRMRSAHVPDAARRRRPVSLASAALVVAAAAIVALALYRLLAHTSGLNLGAGWATVGIAFGAAGVFMFVAPGVTRIGVRRWRWLRAGDDAHRAHIVWREFRDDLHDLGLGYTASEPPRTLADRVTAGLPEPSREAVRRLALAEERASYAARPSGSANLKRDLATARRGIASSVRRSNRWRARIFPVSVMTAVADGAALIPDRVAALVSRRWNERRSTS